MKVLVFAHTPPPFHGQSYMVAQLLENVGGRGAADGEELTFHHVNARLSRDLEDIGSWRIGKLLLLAGRIVEAWVVWLCHRPDVFYYVPGPAKTSAIFRDWLVLLLLAPLFPRRAYHWHAAGLGSWVSEGLGRNQLGARLTRWLFRNHELSIVMNDYARAEVKVFAPQRIEIVANGIADPCPDFASAVLPERGNRLCDRTRKDGGSVAPFRLLFLGLATASKGLFDSIDAVARANTQLEAEGSARRVRLTVAGAFIDSAEEKQFRQRLAEKDLLVFIGDEVECAVTYAGHVDALFKAQLLRESDALCFASYFPNEVQPVSIVESLAFGMPVILTRWHGLPSMIPAELSHLIEPRDVTGLADRLPQLFDEERFAEYRRCYLERYTIAQHCGRMRAVLLSLR